MTTKTVALVLAVTLSWTNPAFAHHEAIFGPNSTLVMSAPKFVGFQTYVRRTGSAGTRARETTSMISAGVQPFRRVPLSLTAIVPVSRISNLEAGSTFNGREDVILGARYRVELQSLQDRFRKEGNFLMFMGAAEVPSGNVDHGAFDGAMDYMTAGLGSVEKGAFSGIGYVFSRLHGTSADVKPGNILFLGGGIAWTPLDNPSSERLLSFQAGFTHERYSRDFVSGTPDSNTGGQGTLVHPTVVWGPGGRVLLFGTTSFPIAQRYQNVADEDRWRAGFGVMWLLGD